MRAQKYDDKQTSMNALPPRNLSVSDGNVFCTVIVDKSTKFLSDAKDKSYFRKMALKIVSHVHKATTYTDHIYGRSSRS